MKPKKPIPVRAMSGKEGGIAILRAYHAAPAHEPVIFSLGVDRDTGERKMIVSIGSVFAALSVDEAQLMASIGEQMLPHSLGNADAMSDLIVMLRATADKLETVT